MYSLRDKINSDRPSGVPILPSLVVFVAVVMAGCASEQQQSSPRQVTGREANGIAFVDNNTCAECHQQEFDAWTGSHHDWSMRHADESSVLGDFTGVSFEHFGVESRFYKEEDKLYVDTEGPDGESTQYEIKYTFGVEPLQQYLIEFPGGRLQSLTIAWDVEDQRWFHLYPDEHIPPGDPLHWTRRFQNWNMMCAECHSTDLRKNYDVATDSYDTTWSEMNVSCQACHGPGEEHVDWARSLPSGGATAADDRKLVVNYSGADPRYEVDSCARCHSRRRHVSSEDAHGRPFMDDFLVSHLREDLYYPDGQILDEVYVYGSFVQSRMYHEGVRCSDCHDPHSLSGWESGNDLCTRCHQVSPPEDFPNLQAKAYDTPDHHFHPQSSAGAQCVECHMPARTYMVVDPRRDHSLRIPRPDLSVTLDVPNACNNCHDDESPEWAAAAVRKWYGNDASKEHFAETIAAGRRGRRDAQGPLLELASDPDQPEIARATAIELLRRLGPNDPLALRRLAGDESATVRVRAASAFETVPPEQSVPVLESLLKDPIRAVRIEAARVLAGMPAERRFSIDQDLFSETFAEFEEAQHAMADTPGAHLNLGFVYERQGEPQRAEEQYLAAIRLEPSFAPARLNLATLYNQLGRNEEAEEILRETIELVPEAGEAHYSLGLLLAEMNRIEDAAESLGRAADLLANRARARYNYALALQRLERRPEAEQQLLAAYETDPSDPSILNALTTFYLQDQNLPQALLYAERLAELVPEAPGPQDLIRRLREQLAR